MKPETIFDLIESMRDSVVLKTLDQRYQKGYRDAVDIIDKWLIMNTVVGKAQRFDADSEAKK